ncbi:AI-2E family transporter [Paludisphaera borealis]|uniref:AI-2 transport protein TqsA n=1 Tax=Paludisphaera borealis TaxID=1387353 RepID=A0A1U7CUM3_9BACT|nr:AI-2E family transporter [Paludisphaera borealis]APW62608.1 AI-2 transport protein TqsA [Paludisphaera borealis]
MDRAAKYAASSQVILAVLGVVGALYLLKTILAPIAFALMLACILSPVANFFRRWFPFGPMGALGFFLMLVLGAIYLASLTAESLVHAANTLPSDIERLAGQVSARITDLIRDQPYLRVILPEPGTIDRLGDTNRALLIEKLSLGLTDFTAWVVQGFIVLVLVIFLLIESDMLSSKVLRFFARTPESARSAHLILDQVTRKIRAYLIARTIINLGLGLVVALGLWVLGVNFALPLGLFAAVTNFIPYIGQLAGGALPTLIALGQSGSLGDGLIVAAMYLAVVGIEGYVVTPMVMGKSLDLNGTTVLIACLFWGYIWGLSGLILAMPITASLKLVCQTVPELNRWAELMSVDWQSPSPADTRKPAAADADFSNASAEPAPASKTSEPSAVG